MALVRRRDTGQAFADLYWSEAGELVGEFPFLVEWPKFSNYPDSAAQKAQDGLATTLEEARKRATALREEWPRASAPQPSAASGTEGRR